MDWRGASAERVEALDSSAARPKFPGLQPQSIGLPRLGCSIGHDFAPLRADTSTMRCSMPDGAGAVVSRCAHGYVRGACVLACAAGVLALLFVFSSTAVAMTACQPSRPSDPRDYLSWRLLGSTQFAHWGTLG